MEKPLSQKLCSLHGVQTMQDLLFRNEKEIDNLIINNLCEKEVDKFTNEVRINTFRSRTFAFPHNYPIDLLYISKPEGERFYVLYTGKHWIASTGFIIFNIDGRTNIKLKTDHTDEFLKGKTVDELRFWVEREQQYRKEYRSYLYISKEDFLKCCNANHLSVRVCIDDSSPIAYETDYCDELIPYFQRLYNQTCDDQMFEIDKERMQSRLESVKARFKKTSGSANEVTSNKGCSFMLFFLLIVVAGSALTFFSL